MLIKTGRKKLTTTTPSLVVMALDFSFATVFALQSSRGRTRPDQTRRDEIARKRTDAYIEINKQTNKQTRRANETDGKGANETDASQTKGKEKELHDAKTTKRTETNAYLQYRPADTKLANALRLTFLSWVGSRA